MKYTEFVKANYDKVANLPAKQRMAKLGQMWKASGHSSAKGKGVAGGSEGGMFIKRKGGKKGKASKVRGKGIISDVLGSVGLGVEPEGGDAKGSGILSDLVGSVGLGMKKRGRKPKGGNVVGGATVGGDIADQIKSIPAIKSFLDMGSLFGLGMGGSGVAGGDAKGGGLLDGMLKTVVESVLGGGVAGGDAKGSGLFSSILGSVGLGMPDKIKSKHLNRMKVLEKELHEKGKLTAPKHQKLKVYHTLHGAGFFDSLLDIGKKVVGAVPKAIASIPTVLQVVPEAAKYIPSALTKIAPLAAMV